MEEWLDASPLHVSSVMLHTGNVADVVTCNVLRVTSNTTRAQHSHIMEHFIHPSVPGLSSHSVELPGNKFADVVVCDDAKLEADGLTLIEVVHRALTINKKNTQHYISTEKLYKKK